MATHRWILTLAVSGMLLGSACSTGDDERSNGDLSDDRTGATAKDPQVEFAQCMRDNGIETFPDPGPDGRIIITPESGIAEDPDFEAANGVCDGLLRDAVSENKIPRFDETQQEMFLAMAQCMREHGIDMPDPSFEDGRATLGLGDLDLDDPAFREAQRECRDQVGMPEPSGPGGAP